MLNYCRPLTEIIYKLLLVLANDQCYLFNLQLFQYCVHILTVCIKITFICRFYGQLQYIMWLGILHLLNVLARQCSVCAILYKYKRVHGRAIHKRRWALSIYRL